MKYKKLSETFLHPVKVHNCIYNCKYWTILLNIKKNKLNKKNIAYLFYLFLYFVFHTIKIRQ